MVYCFETAKKKISIFFKRKLPVRKTVVYLQPLRQTVRCLEGVSRETGRDIEVHLTYCGDSVKEWKGKLFCSDELRNNIQIRV